MLDVSILGLARSPTSTFFAVSGATRVSILGLARSPTVNRLFQLCQLLRFQYLGSRGAQPIAYLPVDTGKRFNTWAREEPNIPHRRMRAFGKAFQYLGSRGAQLIVQVFENNSRMFQYLGSRGAQLQNRRRRSSGIRVSILGLARSPTCLYPQASYPL